MTETQFATVSLLSVFLGPFVMHTDHTDFDELSSFDVFPHKDVPFEGRYASPATQ